MRFKPHVVIYNYKGEEMDRSIAFQLDHIVDVFNIYTTLSQQAVTEEIQRRYEVRLIKPIMDSETSSFFEIQVRHTNRNLTDTWFAESLSSIHKITHPLRRIYARKP